MTAVAEVMLLRAALAGGPVVWPGAFAEWFAMVAGEFARAPSRRRARGYLLGLLSHGERKSGRTIAEFAGDARPEGMQRLLSFYSWDEDKARGPRRRYAVRAPGDPAGVLAVDERAFTRKGRCRPAFSVSDPGTAERVGNCLLGVFLAYAAPDGSRALTDRELCLPASWTGEGAARRVSVMTSLSRPGRNWPARWQGARSPG